METMMNLLKGARPEGKRLNAELVKIIQSPEFKAKMADIGAEPIGNTSAQMAQQIASETEKFARLVKEAKVEID